MTGRGRPSRASVYERLGRALTELDQRFGGLPNPKEAESIWADIWHQEAHHSTALEGNTLVLREVQMLLDQGRAVGAKPLKEYNEVKGYADAARWVYGQALEPGDWHDGRLLTMSEVRHVHHLAMTPVWDVAPHPDATDREGPGSFREHDIHPFPGGMTPPSWPLVPARMQQWVEDVCASAARVGQGAIDRWLPEELARLHDEFERVHPFIDGNGRTGRLVVNLVLVRLGYPPVVIFKRQRDAYLAAMRRADGGDYGALGPAPSDTERTVRQLANTPPSPEAGAVQPAFRFWLVQRRSRSPDTTFFSASIVTRSPSRKKAMGPPTHASGAM